MEKVPSGIFLQVILLSKHGFPINHVSILEDRSDFCKCKNLFDGVETVPTSTCDMGITWLILANPPRHGIKNAFGIIGCLATKRTAFVAERVDV